ncbi:achaete-scute homolog 1a-like [Ornithodoros turicata]|uniref:achaete-scute homolog 1a-like n=1 Tax=Ornithodoros turicata TaxID=34597 RepID=UPI003139A403
MSAQMLLPSPPSEDMSASAYYGHVTSAAPWTTTTSLPGLGICRRYDGGSPDTPDSQSDDSSRDSQPSPTSSTSSALGGSAVTSSSSSKSNYKHVPHREKPPHLVARRNARERRRVQAVNNAFSRLRKCVPVENRSKRLSKVKTLHRAIEYIHALQDILEDADKTTSVSSSVPETNLSVNHFPDPQVTHNNKENDASQRWITLENAVCSAQESYSNYLSFYEEYPTGFAS